MWWWTVMDVRWKMMTMKRMTKLSLTARVRPMMILPHQFSDPEHDSSTHREGAGGM